MSGLLQDPLGRFIAQLVVTIGLARLFSLVARKLGQPSVVAEITAGIVLGPSVMGALAPSATAALFPEGSIAPLQGASQLGVVLFAFLIGLELDPAQLRGRARSAVAIAIAGVVVPFALGCAAALPVTALVSSRAPTLDVAMFIGTAMAVTAFPVLARILTEHHLLRTQVGALAVASAAVTDVIAWCALAFVVAAARAEGTSEALVTTGLAIAFVLVMRFGVRPLLDRLVERSNAPVTLTHDVTAVLVLGALASAWITHAIGVHLVFGGFVFGALVPKRDGFARALAEKLEDVVLVVLLPLFFVISGLRTDFQMMGSARDLLACAVMLVVASAGKLGATTLAARLTGQSWREAGALGILMNTRGLMELIVLNVGFEIGVLSPALFSMMVVMVLATTVMAGPALTRVYPARDAIRRLLAVDPPARGGDDRIMACISHARVGPAMARVAHLLAGERTELVAVHLTRDSDEATVEPPDGSVVLAPALACAEELGLRTRPLSFPSTRPADDLVRIADMRTPEVLLLGYHKPLLSQTLLGGVVHDVLREAEPTVAVLVDRDLKPRPESLLLPYHGTAHDRAALRLAARIQRATGASVTVLCVDPLGAVENEVRIVAAQLGARVTVEVIQDRGATQAIVARSHAADLVIVGVGREWGTEAKRIGFGFGAERLIRDCPSSLLIVRERMGELARAKVEA
jgi:Kef-type K+ transport system membrane component KefB/nucleotide-binding universal stress UspA family protein